MHSEFPIYQHFSSFCFLLPQLCTSRQGSITLIRPIKFLAAWWYNAAHWVFNKLCLWLTGSKYLIHLFLSNMLFCKHIQEFTTEAEFSCKAMLEGFPFWSLFCTGLVPTACARSVDGQLAPHKGQQWSESVKMTTRFSPWAKGGCKVALGRNSGSSRAHNSTSCHWLGAWW